MNKYATNHVEAKRYPFRDQMLTMAEIAKVRGVCFSCISRRLKAGTPLDRPSWSPWSKKPDNEQGER